MGNRKLSQKNTEDRMINTIEDLREYEQFKGEILPMLRQALVAGKTPTEILDMVKAHAAARLATIACIEPDSQKALTAIEKVFQRTEGPVVQKTETEHKFSNLPDEQLDAIIKTKLRKSEEHTDEDDSITH